MSKTLQGNFNPI